MIKKRVIASILVNNGYAVQSFGYEKYLPLGDPKILVENLARWKVDEIVITDISSSRNQSSIDFDLISNVSNISKGTPIIYGGGIASSKDASLVIQSGADRIVIENAFVKNKLTPKLSIEIPNNGDVNNIAGTSPINALIKAVTTSEVTISLIFIGEINRFVKFLLQISSRKSILNPMLVLNKKS